jgi:plasmid replication initiation protein
MSQSLKVTKSNDLITASYKMTLGAQRLLLAAIARIDPRRKMPKSIVVSAVDYAEIYNIPVKQAYEQMSMAADELYEADIQSIRGKKIVDRMRWCDKASYRDGEGQVELHFTIHVIPYLSMLHSKVTSYELYRVAGLDSTHSFRLFEMLMQYKTTGWLYLDVEDLRTNLGLGDAYKRFNNLRQRVIDPAITELKAKSGLTVVYECKTKGRKVIALKFTFVESPISLEAPKAKAKPKKAKQEPKGVLEEIIDEIIDEDKPHSFAFDFDATE